MIFLFKIESKFLSEKNGDLSNHRGGSFHLEQTVRQIISTLFMPLSI